MELPVKNLDTADLDRVLQPPTRRSVPQAVRRPRLPRPAPATPRSLLLDFWELTKPEIAFLVTLSALAGFLLGSPEPVAATPLILTLLGTALSAAGGGTLNHLSERHLDARMRRTADRPLPAGRLTPRAALLFGMTLTVAGVATLLLGVNALTALLAALTVVLYLFVYTPLKRRTKYNTFVGTVPGALPALGGYAAATGTLGAGGWALFAILALWQMPHFLSLAWMYRKDYARAGYAMLPVVEPSGDSTARQTVFFTAALAVASLVPTLLGLAGWLYFGGALILGGWFFLPAWAFYRHRTTPRARRVLVASILYIPLLVVLLVVDRLV